MAAFKEPTEVQGRQLLNSAIILKTVAKIKFRICEIWDHGGVGYRVWGV